jgi:ketosteroid isomerase-like protein
MQFCLTLPNGRKDVMNDVDFEINAAEDEWGGATIAANVAALQRIIADDAMMFHGSGNVEGKAPFIANLFRRLEFESVCRDHVLIRQYAPTVAIASCLQEQRIRLRGSDAPFSIAYANISRVWVNRNGYWQMVNYHATRLQSRP